MRRFLFLLGMALVLTGCNGESGTSITGDVGSSTNPDGNQGTVTPFAVVASANGSIGTGSQRIMFALIDRATDEYLASENRNASMTLRDQFGAPIETYPMHFVYTVPGVRGVYAANVDIPEAGTYQVTIDADGLDTAGPVGLVTVADPTVLQDGEAAVLSDTKTADDVDDLSLITSDPDPDPEMYQVTVGEAVTSGRPSVIVFATPAFCTSQACGPLLEQTKRLRIEFPEVNFVHVEVYDDLQVESFEELRVVPAIQEWGLPSEPWVFVVDAAGTVSARFEGAATDSELLEAIEAVSS